MAEPNPETTCICGHDETEHFKYGVPLNRGRCKLDGESDHYCIQFESITAQAARQQAYQEKCKRLVQLIDELGLLCGHDPSSDVIQFDYQGHHYRIEEVDND